MSYPKNYTKNCILYNQILWNDIKSYKIEDTLYPSEVFRLIYTEDGASSVGEIRHQEIKSIIDMHKPSLFTEEDLKDVWLPAIISHDNYVSNKEIVLGNVIGSKTLGIENVISFRNIKLKNWTIANGSVSLCFDWLINTNQSAYDVDYGVLFWYKKNGMHINSKQYRIEEVPNGTKISPLTNLTYISGKKEEPQVTIPAGDLLVKVNSDTFRWLSKDSSKFEGSQISIDADASKFVFNTSREHEIIPISNIKNIYNKEDNILFRIPSDNTLSIDLLDYDLWISNGEFYSYFLGGKDKYDRKEYLKNRMPSRSYLSPSIYHIYRTIYNILTINRVKVLDGLGPVYALEKLKKLCYILATSPLIDRVTINWLQDQTIQDTIYQYLASNSPSTSYDEIIELLNVIAKIFMFYRKHSFFIDKQTLAHNYIHSRTDLFKNLANKYGAYLRMEGDTKLTYNKKVSSGSHGHMDIQVRSFIRKDYNPEVDIFNDIKIDFGELYAETQMNPKLSPSGCLLNLGSSIDPIIKKIVPLSNMAIRKTPEKILTTFNKDVKIELETIGEVIKVDGLVGIVQPDLENELSERISYSWSLVDGPDCLRFSDFNKNRQKDVLRKNRTSTDQYPSLYVKQTGLYVIQGTMSFGSTLKSIENIRVYVHDTMNNYEPNKKVPDLLVYNPTEDDISKPKEYRSMCPNIRQIAFHRNGMIWSIDSDMFICDFSYPSFPRDKRFVDQKINLQIENQLDKISEKQLEKLFQPASVSITFKPNDTIMKLSNIKLENMRDGSKELCQCKSFYEPKLARQRDTNDQIQTGAARFYRINKSPSSVDVLDHELVENSFWRRNKLVSFELPSVSMVNGSPVSSYGGYSQNVIENIGVEIPFHPVNVNGTVMSYKEIPKNIYWNKLPPTGEQENVKESGLIASDPANLPMLGSHNYMGGSDPSIRCHLVNIPVTGYTIFDKGYFHPNCGWYSYEPSKYNPLGYKAYTDESNKNVTSIKKFKTEWYDSYYFEGVGFYDVRPCNTASSGIKPSGYYITDDTSYNKPVLYKSAIEIIPYTGYNRPWQDQDFHYGIRNFNGINYKDQELIDDFVLLKDREVPADFYCEHIPLNQYVLKNDPKLEALTIENIELKINYINMPNLKNIIFSLEIYNPELDDITSSEYQNNKDKIFISFGNNTDRTSDPETWLDKVGAELEGRSSLLSFIKALKTTNTCYQPNTRIVYLYNQESFDNYNYNFSLSFSDDLSKRYTFSDENKISVSGVGLYSLPIGRNDTIAPCISPTGYSEKDSVTYRQIIKNNDIHLLEGSLSQFKKIPLKNTKFTLVAHVLGPEENILSLDNTVMSSYLSGLVSYKSKPSSNTIANSICSWNIIIHTLKSPKFTNQDYLGNIDYQYIDNISPSIIKYPFVGYNFIADMTDKGYMIPKININAPYNYISTNNCDYANNEDLSRPFTYDRIEFPFLGFYTPGFFTLVGALVDIQILLMELGRGGRSDPIYNMLLDIRFQRQQEEQERYYFKPIYNGSYLGVPNKTIIQASTDQYNWYRLEVPIFKYDNTAILTKNKYKYIKLHKDIAIGLSNFYFTKINDIEKELFDAKNKVAYTTVSEVPLAGNYVYPPDSNVPIVLKEYDIVDVKFQQNEKDNGLYYVKSGRWIRYSLLSEKSMINNKIFGNKTIEKSYIGYLVVIEGSRAYNLFDEKDRIAVMKEPASQNVNQDLFYHTILNKALINVNNKQLTILTLAEPLAGGLDFGFISKSSQDSNWLIIFKDHLTYLDEMKVGKWGVNKTHAEKNHINNNFTKQTHSVAMSEGSIGYGSNKLQPEIYDSIEPSYPNKILDTEEIFNNHFNDKLKFNNITLIQYVDKDKKEMKNISFFDYEEKANILTAYPYRNEDMEYSINSLFNYSVALSSGVIGPDGDAPSGVYPSGSRLDVIKQSLKNNLEKNNQNYYFIDLKSNKFKEEITYGSGEIILENDYVKSIPRQFLMQSDVNLLKTRLEKLNKKSDPPKLITAENLDTISSIPDLQSFYNDLPVDPSGCFKKNYYTNETEKRQKCLGLISKQKLAALLEEKKQILEALEIQSNAVTGVTPYYETKISVGRNEAISFTNTLKDYYIIDIDPNQVCTLTDDATIKILKKITHTCEPVVELYDYPECDSACKIANVEFGLDESLKTTYSATAAKLEYTNNRIEEEKAKYPNVVWEENNLLIINKIFFLSCEDNVRETMVKVKEEYIVPAQTLPARGLVKDIFNLDDFSKIFIKFRNIPRKIKTIDSNYTRYIYDYYGRLGEDIIPPPGGPIYNDFYAWQCIKVRANREDPYQDNQYGEFIEPPDFYKFMNEMIFRGFFGSVDGVENKNTDIMDSKEPYEWIPYEYFGKKYYFGSKNIQINTFNAQNNNSEFDGDWGNPDNWYLDKERTKPAASVPAAMDSVELYGDTIISANSSGKDIFVSRIIFNDRSSITVPIQVYSEAIFNDVSSNESGSFLSIGKTIFNNRSSNLKKIKGSVIFNSSSINFGEITPTLDDNDNIISSCEFNDKSINRGFVQNRVILNDEAKNDKGTITAIFSEKSRTEITFNDKSFNDQGKVYGDTIFNGESQSDNGVFNGDVSFHGQSINKDSSYLGYSVLAFNGNSVNLGKSSGGEFKFNDSSYNAIGAYIGADYIEFRDSTQNFGELESKLIVFRDNSTNQVRGKILKSGSFVGGAINYGKISDTGFFSEGSTNYGTIEGEGKFEASINEGSVDGESVFDKGSINRGFLRSIARFNNRSKNEWSFGIPPEDKEKIQIKGDSYFFTGSMNLGLINRAFFDNYSINKGIVFMDAFFSNSSINEYIVVENASFQNNSENRGTVRGKVTMNG